MQGEGDRANPVWRVRAGGLTGLQSLLVTLNAA